MTDAAPTAVRDAADAEPQQRHRVVVVGGGFGGLNAVRALAHADVDVTVIDRTDRTRAAQRDQEAAQRPGAAG